MWLALLRSSRVFLSLVKVSSGTEEAISLRPLGVDFAPKLKNLIGYALFMSI